MSLLFSPLEIREVLFKNRIFVSPMCQYSSEGGLPNDWHMIHLGSRAAGGAGLVIVEATSVSPEGRISPADSGMWEDKQAQAYRRITDFIKSQGSVPGIQLAHAGRKASTKVPWTGNGPLGAHEGAWETMAPSGIPFAANYPVPKEMSEKDITDVIDQFRAAARRSLAAGFEVVEVHMAHGYLLHQFLSPLTNKRKDAYGGGLRDRAKLPLEAAKAVREAWPKGLPVFVRISATDWVEGGWDIGQSVQLAKWLKEIGIDLIDCSSGGLLPDVKIPAGPGFQLRFSEAVRREAKVLTGGVGMIIEPLQAEQIIVSGLADAVIIGREFLRDAYWPLHAAQKLGFDVKWPNQYLRVKP
jgi:2,4-dienoyl-CoA reductase-like NADH-dependent reductase (Old Yellow Enzyme family)